MGSDEDATLFLGRFVEHARSAGDDFDVVPNDRYMFDTTGFPPPLQKYVDWYLNCAYNEKKMPEAKARAKLSSCAACSTDPVPRVPRAQGRG